MISLEKVASCLEHEVLEEFPHVNIIEDLSDQEKLLIVGLIPVRYQ